MIGRLINRVLDWRIRHHSQRAAIFGAATLAAQIRRDWPAASRFLSHMHDAQAKRDALARRRFATTGCCNGNCNEGRSCPLRAAR